jgi:hypothetical protein
MSEVAARGFLNLPGYAYVAGTQLEVLTKRNLSELSLKILAETIERELKQTGLDYDLSYKNARMAWEIEKQSLLSAWDMELALIKQGQALAEETLDQMAIEVGKRAGVLLERKTELDIEAEEYRTTIAELDGLVVPYEVQLANAKLLTAQKKLELIPILQEIISKEQDLLVAEQTKSAEYNLLMDAEREVIDKKRTRLLPAISALVNTSEQYTIELSTQTELEHLIALEKVTQSSLAVDVSEKRLEIANIEVDIEEVQLDILEKKMSIADLQDETEEILLQASTDDTREITNIEAQSSARILTDTQATDTYVLDKKRTIQEVENETKDESTQRLTESTISAMNDVTTIEVNEINDKTDVQAAATLTAQLTHLIS